jgi:hypothetical protein
MYYRLERHKAVVESDLSTWARWFGTANRVVKQTEVAKGVEVSTVFLGIDHNFSRSSGDPVLFETLIFGGARDQECERYRTWDEAAQGHERIVESFTHRCAFCGTLRYNDDVKCIHCNAPF